MILYLLLCSLLVPANAWAAITPHLHSDISMRILHGLSTAVLVPLLAALWKDRHLLKLLPPDPCGVLRCDAVGERLDHRHGHGGSIRLA